MNTFTKRHETQIKKALDEQMQVGSENISLALVSENRGEAGITTEYIVRAESPCNNERYEIEFCICDDKRRKIDIFDIKHLAREYKWETFTNYSPHGNCYACRRQTREAHPGEPEHSGLYEFHGSFDTREKAEERAKELNLAEEYAKQVDFEWEKVVETELAEAESAEEIPEGAYVDPEEAERTKNWKGARYCYDAPEGGAVYEIYEGGTAEDIPIPLRDEKPLEEQLTPWVQDMADTLAGKLAPQEDALQDMVNQAKHDLMRDKKTLAAYDQLDPDNTRFAKARKFAETRINILESFLEKFGTGPEPPKGEESEHPEEFPQELGIPRSNQCVYVGSEVVPLPPGAYGHKRGVVTQLIPDRLAGEGRWKCLVSAKAHIEWNDGTETDVEVPYIAPTGCWSDGQHVMLLGTQKTEECNEAEIFRGESAPEDEEPVQPEESPIYKIDEYRAMDKTVLKAAICQALKAYGHRRNTKIIVNYVGHGKYEVYKAKKHVYLGLYSNELNKFVA